MRKEFMNPRNYLRMQEALLSLLSGDPFRGTQIYWSVRASNALYYLTSLIDLQHCVAAWLRRKLAICEAQLETRTSVGA